MWLEARATALIKALLSLYILCNAATCQNQTAVDRVLLKSKKEEPSLDLTASSTLYGYSVEEHTVITEDGYILSVFRILKGKNCMGRVRRTPVLLMHGLLLSSRTWEDAGPSASLPFLISDACFDLWMGNVRGNYYGRRHVRLDPDRDPAFWKFYTDEMGRYDLTATVDYILNNTGSNKLNYIGHSQGGRIFFIMCSERPGYCDKVGVSIGLAPAVKVGRSRSISIKALVEYYRNVEPFLTKPSELEVLPEGGLIQRLGASICQDPGSANTICRAILTAIDSYHPGSVTTETLQVLFKHFPAGTSARNLAHYGQNAKTGAFQKYDFGPAINLELYGSTVPPFYDLKRTTTPVVILYSINDFLVVPEDAHWLISQLPNVIEGSPVNDLAWTHFDHVYSKNIKHEIFNRIENYLITYGEEKTNKT